jgi:hypothetical protein
MYDAASLTSFLLLKSSSTGARNSSDAVLIHYGAHSLKEQDGCFSAQIMPDPQGCLLVAGTAPVMEKQNSLATPK